MESWHGSYVCKHVVIEHVMVRTQSCEAPGLGEFLGFLVTSVRLHRRCDRI